MNLYLIRHAKTDSHLNGVRQSPETPLGEYGLKQAQALTTRADLNQATVFYSSPWPRSLQTAQVFNNREIKIHPLLHEIKKPEILDNIPEDSDLNWQFLHEREQNLHNFDWKFHGGGESSSEALARAKKIIDFLVNNHTNDSVALFSHGQIMTLIAGLLLSTPDSPIDLVDFCLTHQFANTGVTALDFDPNDNSWKLRFFNDTSHMPVDP